MLSMTFPTFYITEKRIEISVINILAMTTINFKYRNLFSDNKLFVRINYALIHDL